MSKTSAPDPAKSDSQPTEAGDAAAKRSATDTQEGYAQEGSCCLGCSLYGGTAESCQYLYGHAMGVGWDVARVLSGCGNIQPLKS